MDHNTELFISADKEKVDIDFVYHFLSRQAYWCKGIPLDLFKQSVENSQNFSLYFEGKQVAYARVITDFATIAYLGDVFVAEEQRGKGFSKKLMTYIMSYPPLQGLRRWILLTGDAHGLYEQFGWTRLNDPNRWMELHDKKVYDQDQADDK